jgi:hypothetical protein
LRRVLQHHAQRAERVGFAEDGDGRIVRQALAQRFEVRRADDDKRRGDGDG